MKYLFKRLTPKKRFYEVLNEWLLAKKTSVKSTTYTKYLLLINNHILPYFGNFNFKKIKSKDLNNFFALESITLLSNSTKNTILTIINSTIIFGINHNYRVDFPKTNYRFNKENSKLSYFTKKEQEQMEMYIKNNINLRNLIILVALYTGARLGELCALKGSDIDIINNTITINKTVQRIKVKNCDKKTKLIVDAPKTKSSFRVIPAPVFIIDYLKNFIKDEDNFIFTNSNIPKDPRAVEKYFKSLLNRLNIKELNFHALRHTFATRLRELKIDIKVISELLGHASWKLTQSIYIHASIDYKKESIAELGSLWNEQFVEVI